MTISLFGLNSLDKAIAAEHYLWLEQYLQANPAIASVLSLNEMANLDFGLLNHPHLWPSNRIGKTAIYESDQPSVIDFIQRQIHLYHRKRILLGKNKPALALVQQFDKDYQIFIKFLIRKFLKQATQESIEILIANAKPYITLDGIFEPIIQLSSLQLQLREDCIEKHNQITKLIQRVEKLIQSHIQSEKQFAKLATSKNANLAYNESQTKLHLFQQLILQLRQVGYISKRYIDGHLARCKKISKSQYRQQLISSCASLLSLLFGTLAVILTIAGIFFPPLWLPANILGYMSLISFIGTTISLTNLILEGFKQRSPDKQAIYTLVYDSIVLPMYFIGFNVISSLGTLLTNISQTTANASNSIHQFFNSAAILWDSYISNLDSVLDFKESFILAKQSAKGYQMVMNSTSAVSWSYVTTQLSLTAPIHQVLPNISHHKLHSCSQAKLIAQEIKELTGQYYSYQYTYTLFTVAKNKTVGNIIHIKSYHQAILTFLDKPLPLSIKLKLECYSSLAANTPVNLRMVSLTQIQRAIADNANQHSLNKILKNLIDKEIENIEINLSQTSSEQEFLLMRHHIK